MRVGVVDRIPGSTGEDFFGRPLLDAAFDPTDSNIIYVVPVEVTPKKQCNRTRGVCTTPSDCPPSNSCLADCPFVAAAKLQRKPDGTYDILQLYGQNPQDDPEVTVTPADPGDMCWVLLLNPDRQRLREIEVDTQGRVYVSAAQSHPPDPFNPNAPSNSESYLLAYDSRSSQSAPPAEIFQLPENAQSPIALTASASAPGTIYLSSSAHGNESTWNPITKVFRFSVPAIESALSSTGFVALDANNISHCDGYPCSFGDETIHGHIAAITALVEDSTGAIPKLVLGEKRHPDSLCLLADHRL